MESIPAPERPFELVIPKAGSLATIASGDLRTGTRPRKTLGAVKSAVFFHDVLVVAGDFDNAWALGDSEQGQPEHDYEVASALPNSVLAAGDRHLAVNDSRELRIAIFVKLRGVRTPLRKAVETGTSDSAVRTDDDRFTLCTWILTPG